MSMPNTTDTLEAEFQLLVTDDDSCPFEDEKMDEAFAFSTL